jgi:excisionase family DNA binding protein
MAAMPKAVSLIVEVVDVTTGNPRPPAPLAYPVPTAARMISVSVRQLYRLLAAGELEAKKVRHRTVITASELERFLRTRPAYPTSSTSSGAA